MKLLFDYFPVLCFFIAFLLHGIYVATAVTMIACLLQVSVYWLKHRRFEQTHLITLVLVLLLGGATLIFHDALFIKLKPSILYWIFSLILFTSQFIGEKPVIERLFKETITAPRAIWLQINLAWAIFLLLLGFLNLYVVYHFSTTVWVYFKFLGTLGLMLIFILIQAMYLAKYVNEDALEKKD